MFVLLRALVLTTAERKRYIVLLCLRLPLNTRSCARSCTCSWRSQQLLLDEKMSHVEAVEKSWSDYDGAYVDLLSRIDDCQKELGLVKNDSVAENRQKNLSQVKVRQSIGD
jgi:hypothetical protein